MADSHSTVTLQIDAEKAVEAIRRTLESEPEVLRVKRLSPTATLPRRAKPGDAGLDLFADLGDETARLTIWAGGREKIPTGVAMVTPAGTYGRIADRSGIAANTSVHVRGGVCDQTYRGEYKVSLHNTGDEPFVITHGMRVAQLILERISLADPVEVEELDETERGAGGFGSTGLGAIGGGAE